MKRFNVALLCPTPALAIAIANYVGDNTIKRDGSPPTSNLGLGTTSG